MTLNDLLILGDQRLYQVCEEVERSELPAVATWAQQMDSVILAFRKMYGAGRAIAAPQLGIMKRLVCMHIDKPVVMINPKLFDLSDELMELWDDCMSFPNLLVRLNRHRSCTLTYRDQAWVQHTWHLEGDLSELIQHEVDHLNGILAIDHAIDYRSFKWRPTPALL